MGDFFICMYSYTVGVRPQCYSDNDCSRNRGFNDGNCVEACRIKQSGDNAKCEIRFHAANRICLPGYTVNAEVACNPCKY